MIDLSRIITRIEYYLVIIKNNFKSSSLLTHQQSNTSHKIIINISNRPAESVVFHVSFISTPSVEISLGHVMLEAVVMKRVIV